MLRSLLFIPGNNPNMLANGDIFGADGVIFDLEDAVSPDEKDAARILTRNALKHLSYKGITVIIRINPIDSANYWIDDLEELIPLKPHIILPPKVNGPSCVKTVSDYISKLEDKWGISHGETKLMPLIESALGIEKAYEIGSADKRVCALFLGGEDLTADLQCERTKKGDEIFYARCKIVAAARAAGIEPIDTPFTDVNDQQGIYDDAKTAKALGFSGKASISPRHINAINQVFSPSQKDIEYACEVMEAIKQGEAAGKGAVSLYGKMIDKPIVKRAEQVISMAKRLNLEGGPGYE